MRFPVTLLLLLLHAAPVSAFCGFYVARADGELFNEASKVVFLRDGTRSVITLSSDYRGPAADFALVVPAPRVLARDEIRTVEPATVAHLDAYSAPRLVEYHDEDPCSPVLLMERSVTTAAPGGSRGADALGVTIEAQYAVGVYDVAILSAAESNGLAAYLRQEDYRIPDGAEPVLAGYIEGGMKFFVARVNLERHAAAETTDLPPLQLTFDSPAFMLPLQLGKINSAGTQDVLVMALTRRGRVEAANYANARIPSNLAVPGFVRHRFGDFYKSLFARAATANTVLTEYAWDMAWCDPCAADPLSAAELRELGADWALDDAPAQDVFVTRLHFRYDETQFLEDIAFRVTDDRENFQGRYIIRNPFGGSLTCADAEMQPYANEYLDATRSRLAEEGDALARLTGWDRAEIASEIRMSTPAIYHE